MIRINNLTVEIEGKKILTDINLHIPKGEVHLLLGPNGSGKTSLMMTIMGYPQYKVINGNIELDGVDLSGLGITERARMGLGIAEQRPPSISGVRLKMLLDYIRNSKSGQEDRTSELINKTGMTSFLERDINAGLSGGEIKRSELLLLAGRNPGFSMLDEPDSGVDLDSLELLVPMINTLFSPDAEHPAKRNTGLIITHSSFLSDRLGIDRAHVMVGGRLVCSGNPRIILKKVMETGFESCLRCEKNEIG